MQIHLSSREVLFGKVVGGGIRASGLYRPFENKFLIYEAQENGSVLNFFAEAHPSLGFAYVWEEYLFELKIPERRLSASQSIFSAPSASEALLQFAQGSLTCARGEAWPDHFDVWRKAFEWKHPSKIEDVPELNFSVLSDDSFSSGEASFEESGEQLKDFLKSRDMVASIEYRKMSKISPPKVDKDTQELGGDKTGQAAQLGADSEGGGEQPSASPPKLEKETQTSVVKREGPVEAPGALESFNRVEINKSVRIRKITVEVENLDFSRSVDRKLLLNGSCAGEWSGGRRDRRNGGSGAAAAGRQRPLCANPVEVAPVSAAPEKQRSRALGKGRHPSEAEPEKQVSGAHERKKEN